MRKKHPDGYNDILENQLAVVKEREPIQIGENALTLLILFHESFYEIRKNPYQIIMNAFKICKIIFS